MSETNTPLGAGGPIGPPARAHANHRVAGDLNRALAAGVLAVSLLAVSVCLVMLVADQLTPPAHATPDPTPRFAFPVMAVAFAAVGGVLGVRRQSAVIGWLFSGVGLSLAVGALLYEYGTRAQYVVPGSLRGGDVGIWVGDWLPYVMIPAVPVLLLVFPTGRLLSARWRPAMTAAVVAIPVFLLQDMFSSSHLPRALHLGDGGALGAFVRGDLFGLAANLLAPVAALSALTSLGLRIRRAESVERHQLKWFAYSAALVVAALVLASVMAASAAGGLLGGFGAVLFIAAFASLPISVGIAVLKYRLYDIDLVISRTLVYGAMALFITAVYVAIVVGVGTLAGGGGRPNLALSIVATAVVAVAFQPVRERLQRLANRLVFGKRATPYEVLSEFSSRIAESYAGQQVLPRMVQVLAEGTGAEAATVWIRGGQTMRPAAVWPPSGNGQTALQIDVTGQLMPDMPIADRAVPVRHRGELLGALTVTKRTGESLTPIEEKLLQDLAHQAGLVLKNAGLTADLQARLEELRASRQRLVKAQDDERRKLERNLHDGAQQNLVALKVKLGLAEMLTARDPERAKALVAELKADADEALETLRDLARGIYPPLLADQGLEAAVRAQARKASIPVSVDAAGVGRHPQDVEAAVYFCCLEALQNVQKYAGADSASIRLAEGADAQLHFEVRDDGAGFDPAATPRGSGLQNIEDRLHALGGQVVIESSPGAGTRVTGSLPWAAPVPTS